MPLKTTASAKIIEFLEISIITRLEVPSKIITDNATIFRSVKLMRFCAEYSILLSHSSNYYSQGNGLAESSNKNLLRLIRKTIGDNKRSWDGQLKFALWADRITKKRSTGKSPFELVYGLDAVLPINIRLLVYKLLQYFVTDKDNLQARIDDIVQLDEERHLAKNRFADYQDGLKKVFAKKAKGRKFQVGDLVLLWGKRHEKPGDHGKFDSLWLGPYQIDETMGPNTFYLSDLEGERV